MGRGAGQEQEGVPARTPDHTSWIETNFSGASPVLSRVSDNALTGVHPNCPDELNPLLDLPAEIEKANPEDQLRALVETYQSDVLRGQGLMLSVLGMPENRAQWRLLEESTIQIATTAMQRSDSDDPTPLNEDDIGELVLELLSTYQAREAQLHWACQKLGWPSDWVINFMRRNGAAGYNYGPNGPSSTDLRQELQERALQSRLGQYKPAATEEGGPVSEPTQTELENIAEHKLELTSCPSDIDPLEGLPADIASSGIQIQLDALEKVYQPLTDRMQAIEEVTAGKQTARAQKLAKYIRETVENTEDSLTDVMRSLSVDLQAREQELHWATEALHLEYGSVLIYLLSRDDTRSR